MIKYMMLILMLSTSAMALPSDYDTRQDERFWNFVKADAELSATLNERVGWIVKITGAIALMLLGVIGAWIKKRLKL
jgi:hypothetical protein